MTPIRQATITQKAVHDKVPKYLKDLMMPSERLHVHGTEQLLPMTRTDILKRASVFQAFQHRTATYSSSEILCL